MIRLLCALVLLAACGDPTPPPEKQRPVLPDTAALWRQAQTCADAYLAEHGAPPTTLQGFAGIEGNCQRALFLHLDAERQFALWDEQLDYYSRTDSFNPLQRAAFDNIRSLLSPDYFRMPPHERPEPDGEEITRVFSAERAGRYFYKLGTMYE